jgi:hypothetical protein
VLVIRKKKRPSFRKKSGEDLWIVIKQLHKHLQIRYANKKESTHVLYTYMPYALFVQTNTSCINYSYIFLTTPEGLKIILRAMIWSRNAPTLVYIIEERQIVAYPRKQRLTSIYIYSIIPWARSKYSTYNWSKRGHTWRLFCDPMLTKS